MTNKNQILFNYCVPFFKYISQTEIKSKFTTVVGVLFTTCVYWLQGDEQREQQQETNQGEEQGGF